jgi:hypothetical protein
MNFRACPYFLPLRAYLKSWFGGLLERGAGQGPAKAGTTNLLWRVSRFFLKQGLMGFGLFALLLLPALSISRAAEYTRNEELTRELETLAKTHPKVLRLERLTNSPANRPVWCAEITTADKSKRSSQPALLAVAGIEGNDLAGTASLLAWMHHLVTNFDTVPDLKSLVDSTTIYVLPRVNPDGAENYFKKPRLESAADNTPVDDDHDGLMDEDGPDDINGDNLISWMRIKGPEGEYIIDPIEPRLLLKADRAKGEVGAWKLISEGIDDDHDEEWNEDGPGGVNYNCNFSYNYKFFTPWSGVNPISEGVTRSLAEFVINHPNIGIVFTFGAPDNLVQAPKGEPAKRPPVGINEGDIDFYKELGKGWREALGLKKELTGGSEPGSFSDWIYFHRGRLSLAARPWSPAIQLALSTKQDKKEEVKPKGSEAAKDETPGANAAPEKKPDDDKRNEEDRAFLKWVDQNAPEAFVPWKPFDHPDFKGKTVEIGGFAPFAKSNPPEKFLEEFSQKHITFLTQLIGKLPRINFRKIEVKPLGNGVYDVVVEIQNTGYLPTSLAQGEITREVHQTRVELIGLDDAQILSGQKRTMLGPILGSGGMKEARWILNGRGRSRIPLRVTSMLGGLIEEEIELKETN